MQKIQQLDDKSELWRQTVPFKSVLCRAVAGGLWTTYLTSLSLSISVCKMGTITPISHGCCDTTHGALDPERGLN